MRSLSISLALGIALTQNLQADDKTHRWDLPTAYENYHTDNAIRFADCVRRTTEGSIVITVHGGGDMLRGAEIWSALESGEVTIAERLLSAHAHEHPVFGIDSVPFLATSYEASDRLLRAAEQSIRAALQAKNLHLLYSVPWPPQDLFFQRKIETFSDMKGIKARAYNPRTARFAELTEMEPVWIDIAEISQGVATGYWEALITSAKTIAQRKLWEVNMLYGYQVGAWVPRNSVLINLDAWRALADGQRDSLTKCAITAAEYGRRLSEDWHATNLAILRDAGMIVEHPGETLMRDFREKVGKPMIAEWIEKAGEEGAEIISVFRNVAASPSPINTP